MLEYGGEMVEEDVPRMKNRYLDEPVIEKLVETGLAVIEREVVPRAGKSGEKDSLVEEAGNERDVLVSYEAVIEKLVETGLAVN